MSRIGLRPGDSLQFGELKLVVISGATVLSCDATAGDKVWVEEITAGVYCLTIGPQDGKMIGD